MVRCYNIHIHIKFKTRANDYIEQTKQTYIRSSLRCTQGYLHNRLRVTNTIIMRPSSLGGGRMLRRTLSVRLSVRPSRACLH